MKRHQNRKYLGVVLGMASIGCIKTAVIFQILEIKTGYFATFQVGMFYSS